MAIVLRCNNSLVTDWYMNTIGDALKGNGQAVEYTDNINDVFRLKKDTVVVSARITDSMRLFLKGYKHIIMWFQGIEPEESLMRHNSKIRYVLLSLIEKYVLSHAEFCLFVSNEMKRHYEEKYKISIDNASYYCMPCQNTVIHEEAFKNKEKYAENCFAYIGSLAVWQKFEETVDCYLRLEALKLPNTRLLVFTGEKEKAEEILARKKVKNYSIDFVKNEDLPEALTRVKYGFIIRDDVAVNRVATPTKISTYLSCGIIPIYSAALRDFTSIASHMKYAVSADESLEKSIIQLTGKIDNDDVLREYKDVFDKYFNAEKHKSTLQCLLKKFN